MGTIKNFVSRINSPPFSKKLLVIKTNHPKNHSPEPKFIIQLIKLFRRHLMLYVFFQYRYLNKKINSRSKRILWIHNTTENIGDSLMKTSSIRFLKANGYSVDLCVTEKFYDLYSNNAYCVNVYKLEDLPINKENYDLIMIDALSSKCMKIKMQFYRLKPFVTLYEFFNYYRADYNLIYFSWYRIQHLIDIDENIDIIARPFVGESEENRLKNLKIKNNSLAIVCGGINEFRTYPHWIKVISLIDKNLLMNIPIVLVGSENGLEYASEIVNEFKDRTELINCVGKYTLSESKAIISKCHMIIGPDGGILQIANALDKKIIALFAQIDCRLRFTKATDYKCLYDESAVKNINPEDVASLVESEIKTNN